MFRSALIIRDRVLRRTPRYLYVPRNDPETIGVEKLPVLRRRDAQQLESDLTMSEDTNDTPPTPHFRRFVVRTFSANAPIFRADFSRIAPRRRARPSRRYPRLLLYEQKFRLSQYAAAASVVRAANVRRYTPEPGDAVARSCRRRRRNDATGRQGE